MATQGQHEPVETDGPSQVDIWSKLDLSVLGTAEPAAKPEPKAAKEPVRFQRARRVFLEIVAVSLWLWVFTKLFVGDIDRWALARWAPNLAWVLDYRAFAVLAILAVAAIAVRGKRWLSILYVVFWPLVVLFYRVPRFIYKRDSVVSIVAMVHFVLAFSRGWRYTAIAVALFAFAVLGIMTSASLYIVGPACAVLLVVWVVTLWRVVVFALSPDRFVRGQHRLVKSVFSKKWFANLAQMPPGLQSPDIKRYSKEQINSLLTHMSMSLTITRGAHYWSQSLEEYRKSNATILTAGLSVLGIFVHGIVTFAVVNYGLYRVSPDEFDVAYQPSLATFLYYTLSAAASSEIGAVVPVGSLATSLQIATAFGAGIIVLLFLTTMVVAFRQSGDDPATDRAIADMRRSADEGEARIASNYGVEGPQVLWQFISDVGGGIFKVLPFLMRTLPQPRNQDS